MGRAGRRKRDDLAYETFEGAGCSSGLQLELASGNDSGYAGVFPTTMLYTTYDHHVTTMNNAWESYISLLKSECLR